MLHDSVMYSSHSNLLSKEFGLGLSFIKHNSYEKIKLELDIFY